MQERYDVVVLGSGLAGGTLAAILGRHGRRVLLLERGHHPRFAVGESLVPEFSFRTKLMAAAFDVPELAYMSNFRSLVRHVSSRMGIKRNFTFLHHTEGREHDPSHSSQFQAMTYPLGPDAHVLRADLDDWLKDVAVERGVDYVERVEVRSVELEEDPIRIVTDAGTVRADYVVDASGKNGALASRLRHAEAELETDTRTLFTHMVGVKRAQDALGDLPVPSPPHQGTLHHVFDGGWFWVIPFGNHRGSSFDKTSVGLTLERRRHPASDLPPEEEFRSFVRRFPGVARQLDGARAVRPWVRTGRLQYSSEPGGDGRWCVLPHAAGFVDALFSGGMPLTMSGVHEAARALLREPERHDPHRFAALGELAPLNLRFIDRVVSGAFVCFRSHALFDAWYRIWALCNYHGSLGLVRIWLKYRAGERSALEEVHRDPYRRVLGSGHPRLRALVDGGWAVLDRLLAGECDEDEAVDGLFEHLGAQEWIPPQFHAADRTSRHLASFSFFPMVSIILWGKRHAPEDVRSAYYDVPPTYFSEVARYLGSELFGGLGEAGKRMRDAFWSKSPA